MQKALLLRPKVWISYHQTLDIKNLNCHEYLTVWIFKKTWILLELSQLLTGYLFNANHTSTQALGSSLLQSGQGLVRTSVLSGLDSGPCGGTEGHGFVKGQQQGT